MRKKRDFNKVLEQGAQVDEIFKDSPAPLGSNPFEEADSQSPSLEVTEDVIPQQPAQDFIQLLDNDSLLSINRKYEALERLFKLVTKDCTFGEMISEILRVAIDLVKSEAGTFFEIDHQNRCMFFRAVTGRSSQSLLSVTVPLGQGVVGFVCENQQPMALSQIDDNSIYLKSVSGSVGFETKNVIAYPVVIRGATFGCLELLNRLGEERYTDSDKEVLAAICEFGAKIIENRLLNASMSKEIEALKRKASEEAA